MMFEKFSNRESLSNMQKNMGISLPSQRPISKSPPDRKKLQTWIENHYSIPRVKEIAEKLAKHINYIPFDTLLGQLQVTITQFNNYDLPYVLWIPQIKFNVGDGCSDLWIAGLCFEHSGLNPPVAIAFTDQLIEVLKQYPTVLNILMLDDASYSASHITGEINRLSLANTLEAYTLFIGIPFMTKHAVTVIQNESKRVFKKNVMLLDYINLPMMNEILDTEELNYLEKEFDYRCDKRTLTYFDHRYPDVFSTLWCFQDGSHLLSSNIVKAMEHLGHHTTELLWNENVKKLLPNSEPVVPEIISPYKQKNVLKLMGDRAMFAKEINIDPSVVADFLENSSKKPITGIEQLLSFFKPKQTLLFFGALTLFLIPENLFADNQSISNLQLALILVMVFFVSAMSDNIKKESQMNFAETPHRYT